MENSIIDKVEAEIVVEEAKAEKKKNIISKLKYALVILIVFAEAVTLGVLAYNRFIPKMQYEKAVAAYEEGNIKDALLAFEKLGDYQNSEYYYNTICNENPTYRFDHCKKGDKITFGKYMYEDIEWVVINVEDDEIILLTKDIIDAGTYPENDALWCKSFVEDCFFGSDNTLVENAFFLSHDQATDYVKDTSMAKPRPTKRALEKEGYSKSEDYGYGWWLSSTGFYSSDRKVANNKGDIGYNNESESSVYGYRPAITIYLGEQAASANADSSAAETSY